MKTIFLHGKTISGLLNIANGVVLVVAFNLFFSINSYAHCTETRTAGCFYRQGRMMDTVIAGTGPVQTDKNTLPLHRLELKAVLHGSSVDLIWFAENEMNTSRFIIQRSNDGYTYEDIGLKAAAGQTYTLTEYRSLDDIQGLLTNNSIYYRIRAEDIDHRFGYSNIVPVKLGTITGIQVWPNPFTSDIRISYTAIAATSLAVRIADNAGRTVKQNTFTVTRGLNQLSVSGIELLPPGMYFINITDKNTNRIYVQKLSK